MRLVLLDCALRDPLHHFLHFDALVVGAAARWGARVEAFGCVGMVDEARAAVGARPHFRHTFHDLLDAPDETAAAAAHAEEIGALFHPTGDAATAWFVPIVCAVQARAWSLVLARRPLGAGETLTLLWNPVPSEAMPSGSAPRRRAREALLALAAAAGGGRVTLVCDSEEHATALGNAPGLGIAVVPITRRVPDPGEVDLSPPLAAPERPVFAVLGDARLDKGFDIAAEAIAQVAADPGCRVSFVVQCHHGASVAVGIVPHVERLLALATQHVRVLLNPLKLPAYEALLQRVHAVVLPYRLEHYALRSSTVFAEAALRALPVVATEGTWMERELRHAGTGMVFRDGDTAALAGALVRAAADIVPLTAAARSRQPLAARRYSVQRFRDILFPHATGAASDAPALDIGQHLLQRSFH